MAGLLIKNVPKEIHEKLKERAAANRRSLSSEVLTILERSLDGRGGPAALEDIDRARIKGRKPLSSSLVEKARRRDRS